MEKSTAYFIIIVLAVLTPILAKILKRLRRKRVLYMLADQLDAHQKIMDELGELEIKETKSFFVDFKHGEVELRMVITGKKGSKFYNIYGSRDRKNGWIISTIN